MTPTIFLGSSLPWSVREKIMPKRTDIHTILVPGSGPIVIGQAAEFDYSGTQAVKALRAEGYRVVLVNSNPATIMTDPEIADATYIEPLTLELLEAIIAQEKPDAMLPTVGGQTGLNLAYALSKNGVLDQYGVQLIGAKLSAIRAAEDRLLFRETMHQAGIPVARGARHIRCRKPNVLSRKLATRSSFVLHLRWGALAPPGSTSLHNLQKRSAMPFLSRRSVRRGSKSPCRDGRNMSLK